MKKRMFTRLLTKTWFVLTLVFLIILLGIAAAYFYKKSQMPHTASQQTQKVLTDVSKIAVLPEGETPTVATVSDPEALKGQVFFVDAKQGYKVLIYSAAKKAILYDPTAKKIVNMASLSLDMAK